MRDLGSGPWHLKQAFERIGLISRLKSSDSEATPRWVLMASSAENSTTIRLAGVTHQVWQPDARGSESPKDVSWIGMRINF